MTGRFESLLLQFVCFLTILGISYPASASLVLRGLIFSPSNDTKVSVYAVMPLQQLYQCMAPRSTPGEKEIASLPDGYAPILNSSVAYKVYKDISVTWVEAKKLCERDGARLAVADNQEIYKYLIADDSNKVHVGIYYTTFEEWISIRDSSTVKNIPWMNGQPDKGCAWIANQDGLLAVSDCRTSNAYYACELPIPDKQPLTKSVQPTKTPTTQRLRGITTGEEPQQEIESTTSCSSVQQVSLPAGYEPFYEIGMAYKFHNEKVTFSEAEERCKTEGGHLATIDSEIKMWYASTMDYLGFYPYILAGIRKTSDGVWRGIGSGLPVHVPWEYGAPERDNGDCVILSRGIRMRNYDCSTWGYYICEVPIGEKSSGTTIDKQPQLQIESLPAGYVAYPDIGMAYKIHDEELGWSEAKKRCRAEGGHLATIDSEKKMRYAAAITKSSISEGVFVGIRMTFDGVWRSIGTGLPIVDAPWGFDEPLDGKQCPCAKINGRNTLESSPCWALYKFICELPISEQNLAGKSLA